MAADAAALSLVGSATMLDTYAEKVPGPDIVAHCAHRHSQSVYADWLAGPDTAIWLAETATGAPVGYLVVMPATLSDTDPHAGDVEIQRIYVLSRFHGIGVGYRLMELALDEARLRGARRLVLGVLKANTRAVAFYRRQGFGIIGGRSFVVGSSVFDDHIMGRSANTL